MKIETVSDLIKIVQTHPEWRRELKKALFPDVDLEKALQRLSETEERILAKQDRLEAGQQEIKTDVAVLKTDVTGLKKDMGVVKTDVGTLKGEMHEISYRLKAPAIFGRFLKRGRDVTHEIADKLQEAETAGQISSDEYVQVLAADLLWGGKTRQGDQEVVLVVEASWLAEEKDVIRAATQAAILRRLGLVVLPVVTGEEWTAAARALAAQERVIVAVDGIVEYTSWHTD